MIARTWRGATRATDAEAYLDYLRETGFRDFRAASGNLGFLGLRRLEGERARFLLISLWEDEEAIRGCVGADIERAVFYPEDERYLVEADRTASHYEVTFEGPDRRAGTSSRRTRMIQRIWHGWTAPEDADRYERLLRERILPEIASREVDGYRGVQVLRRRDGDEVEFVTIMSFASLEAVRAFAGDDPETAYVPPEAREVLARFDDRVHHYELRDRRSY